MGKSDRRPKNARMGALQPRYSFILNPYPDAGFTRCPKCEGKTRIRKLPLVIHVDDFGLIFLGNTCRLCVACEVLIAHQAEIQQVLTTSLGRPVERGHFIVLGTVERQVWRRGLAHPVALDAVEKHMADFRAYLKVEFTPGGWHPKNQAG
jgi:hypothetical protein